MIFISVISHIFCHLVTDVSTPCTIILQNPPVKADTTAAICNGTVNVTILCMCDGMPMISWYGPNGMITRNNDADTYTFINNSQMPPPRQLYLIISVFTDSYNGTYTCKRNDQKFHFHLTTECELMITHRYSQLFICA